MTRYVVVNDAHDATVWRVTEEVGYSVGLIDAELEIKNPDLQQTTQWIDRSFTRGPTQEQLKNFDERLDF